MEKKEAEVCSNQCTVVNLIFVKQHIALPLRGHFPAAFLKRGAELMKQATFSIVISVHVRVDVVAIASTVLSHQLLQVFQFQHFNGL